MANSLVLESYVMEENVKVRSNQKVQLSFRKTIVSILTVDVVL